MRQADAALAQSLHFSSHRSSRTHSAWKSLTQEHSLEALDFLPSCVKGLKATESGIVLFLLEAVAFDAVLQLQSDIVDWLAGRKAVASRSNDRERIASKTIRPIRLSAKRHGSGSILL